jgi:hypothetical protein
MEDGTSLKIKTSAYRLALNSGPVASRAETDEFVHTFLLHVTELN